jgi:acyl-CoA synthetase (AMP-forming)/AMP-acid ligase II
MKTLNSNYSEIFSSWLTKCKSEETKKLYFPKGDEFSHLTYRELAIVVSHCYNDLINNGVKPGSKVVIACGTNIAFIGYFISCILLKAIPIPLSNFLTGSVISEIINLVRPYAIITDRNRKELFAEQSSGTLAANDTTPHIPNFHGKILVFLENGVFSHLEGNVILMSSGTTAVPKAILHKVDSLIKNAFMHADSISLKEEDVVFQCIPMFFSYGLVANMLSSLLNFCTYVIDEQPFYPSRFFATCDLFKITIVSFTPYRIKQLLDLEKSFPKSINKITIGGDKTEYEDLCKLKKFYNGEIYLTYGLTEAGPRVFTNRLTNCLSNWNSLGKTVDSVKVKLHNSEFLHGDEIGELLIQTPSCMMGYLNKDGSIDKGAFISEWLRTHDYVKRDLKTGQFYFIERRKNIIVCGGEKLYSGLIREVLKKHPYVKDIHLYGMPDSNLGQRVSAKIQLHKEREITAEEFKHWCKKYVRPIEIPSQIEFVSALDIKNPK